MSHTDAYERSATAAERHYILPEELGRIVPWGRLRDVDPTVILIIHNATVRAIAESIRSLTAGRDAN